MGDYTDKDRERSQTTFIMLEEHIKHNDERIADIKDILKVHGKKIDTNEKLITKVLTIGSIVIIPITAALTAFGKKFIGN